MRRIKLFVIGVILIFHVNQFIQAASGYHLWLSYPEISNSELVKSYRKYIDKGIFISNNDSEMIESIKTELEQGLSGLLLVKPIYVKSIQQAGIIIALVDELPESVRQKISISSLNVNDEAFVIETIGSQIVVTASNAKGLLYGVFRLLQEFQMQTNMNNIRIVDSPKIKYRILNHWDNLNRTVERGYAGCSIWDWQRLPGYIDQRYIDYARANASIGINGTVLTNVNANAIVLTPQFLEKVAALAKVFRRYNIKVYLTARFSAPKEIGGLPNSDPLNPDVQAWWNNKVKEIYSLIPDFGGFLVKANSEGQPGPQDYGRTHADGANMLARALAPYGGIVMWRAFVYDHNVPVDRAKQAYAEFVPLDGKFDNNVIIQVKNGPIDFQPREPFHPLFGALPKTNVNIEFQITQEYLGFASHLVYLGKLFEECLQSDTYAKGKGSTVAKVVDGSLFNYSATAMAGVSNIGSSINWTGHLFGQANWYAFGKLAWNPYESSEKIAEDWIKLTITQDKQTLQRIKSIMLASREAVVNYMTPLGLHHIMGWDHHYGPAPWINTGRPDWTSVYYHKADSTGIGFDRSSKGSNAVAQYFPEVRDLFDNIESCPEKYLLWFHHVNWDYRLKSGNTLWDELCLRYQQGVDTVAWMLSEWQQLKNKIDNEQFRQVEMLLKIQLNEAVWWKDACLSYFQTFSKRPFPPQIQKPKYNLEYYKNLKFYYVPGI